MREIKFRVKDIKGNWHKFGVFEECLRAAVVQPNTLGQYTGLKDKNGVEIYEGDIVCYSLFKFDGSDVQRKGIVKWSDTDKQMTGYLIWHDNDNEYYGADGAPELGWVCAQDDEIEVIGNIYDNSELLGEQ